jgi:hypothetical protein
VERRVITVTEIFVFKRFQPVLFGLFELDLEMTLSVIDPINLRYHDVIAVKKGTYESVPNNLVTANPVHRDWEEANRRNPLSRLLRFFSPTNQRTPRSACGVAGHTCWSGHLTIINTEKKVCIHILLGEHEQRMLDEAQKALEAETLKRCIG